MTRLAATPRTHAWDALLLEDGELTLRAAPCARGPASATARNGYAFLTLRTRTGAPKWLARVSSFAMHAIF